MNCYFSKKTYTDTLIKQTKRKLQETLEFKMDKQKQTFSFNPPINLIGDGKWLLAVSSFECTISVFNVTYENNSFSITIPGHWDSKSAENSIDELNKVLELTSLELHAKEVRKRGNQIKKGDNEYKLSNLILKKTRYLKI